METNSAMKSILMRVAPTYFEVNYVAQNPRKLHFFLIQILAPLYACYICSPHSTPYPQLHLYKAALAQQPFKPCQG